MKIKKLLTGALLLTIAGTLASCASNKETEVKGIEAESMTLSEEVEIAKQISSLSSPTTLLSDSIRKIEIQNQNLISADISNYDQGFACYMLNDGSLDVYALNTGKKLSFQNYCGKGMLYSSASFYEPCFLDVVQFTTTGTGYVHNLIDNLGNRIKTITTVEPSASSAFNVRGYTDIKKEGTTIGRKYDLAIRESDEKITYGDIYYEKDGSAYNYSSSPIIVEDSIPDAYYSFQTSKGKVYLGGGTKLHLYDSEYKLIGTVDMLEGINDSDSISTQIGDYAYTYFIEKIPTLTYSTAPTEYTYVTGTQYKTYYNCYERKINLTDATVETSKIDYRVSDVLAYDVDEDDVKDTVILNIQSVDDNRVLKDETNLYLMNQDGKIEKKFSYLDYSIFSSNSSNSSNLKIGEDGSGNPVLVSNSVVIDLSTGLRFSNNAYQNADGKFYFGNASQGFSFDITDLGNRVTPTGNDRYLFNGKYYYVYNDSYNSTLSVYRLGKYSSEPKISYSYYNSHLSCYSQQNSEMLYNLYSIDGAIIATNLTSGQLSDRGYSNIVYSSGDYNNENFQLYVKYQTQIEIEIN